jgi:hemerythrin-like metal-binding protein
MKDWKQSYSVQHKILDEQHQIILGLCHRIEQYINDARESDNEALLQATKEFALNVRIHFRTEENILQQSNYPLCQPHKHQHDAYLDILDSILTGENDCSNAYLLKEYLVNWWIDHILCSDMQYVNSITTNNS